MDAFFVPPSRPDALSRLKKHHQAAVDSAAAIEAEAPVLEIGAVMPDGSVYAGTSPTTGGPLFALPEDASIMMYFDRAARFAQELNADNHLGHNDWRVPTKAELDVLSAHRTDGAFADTFHHTGTGGIYWYWSCEADEDSRAWGKNFRFRGKDDGWDQNGKTQEHSVRIVRAEGP